MSSLDSSPATSTFGAQSGAESQQREWSGGTHFVALDGYRAVASFLVLLTHVAFATGLVVVNGWGHLLSRFDIGVALFFLLSGFLLYRPWAKASLQGAPRPSIRRYAVRRAARILPLYLLVVVVTLALLPELQPVSAQTWWTHLLAVQIYTPSGAAEGLTQTWSLCTEIAFYAMLPILGAWLLRRPGDPVRRNVRLLVAMVTVALVFNIVRVTTDLLPLGSAYWLPAYLDWFAVGMGLAVVELLSHRADPPRPVAVAVRVASDQWTCWVVAAALVVIAVSPIAGAYDFNATGSWESLIKHVLYAAAAAFFLLPGVLGGPGPVTSTMSVRALALLGLISYGVFLWHLVLLRWLMPAMGIPVFTGRFLVVTAALVVVTVGVATVTYLVVERPAQRWAHRR